MADDDKEWEDVPAKKSGGTATATADGEWEDVPSKEAAAPAAPEAKEPTFLEKATQGKAGLWESVKHGLNPINIAGDVSESLGKVSDWAGRKAQEKEQESLGNIARGGEGPHMPAYTPASGYDLLSRAAKMGAGATAPENVGIGAAAVALPEIVGPGLLAHGGLGVIKSGADIAEKGLNPENAEQLFTSGAEAAGGGATLGEIPKMGGLRNTLTAKMGRGALKATGGAGLGLGLPAEDLITKGVRPRARAQGWQDAMQSPGVQRAIKEADAATPIQNIEDFHDAIGPMKDKLWNEKVQPALDRQGPRPVDMKPAAQAVRDAITPTMREFNPGGVAALEDLAGKLEKSRTVAEANELQKYANGQVQTYHAKYPTARRAAMNADPDVLGWETARQGIREQLNKTMEDVGETQMADARKDYGHLTTIEKELERKVNPNERKAPINLARTLGLIGAIPTHGASFLAGEVISHMNDPNVLLRRGIGKLNPPAEAPFTPPPKFTPPAPPAVQQSLPLPPQNAPLFNIQQSPRAPVPEPEEPRLAPIQGEQQPLNLPPESAPLFNLQTPSPLGRIGEAPKAPTAPPTVPELEPIGGPGRDRVIGKIGDTKGVVPSPVENVKLPHPEAVDLKPGESTEQRFYNAAKDEWTPERAANHDAVAEAAIKGKTPHTDRPPEAVITMGGTASGKTTITRQILGADKNRVNIDSDVNKLSIPEYEGLKDTDPDNASARVHEESKAISLRTIQLAIKKGLDFIYDTSTGGGGEKLFKKLKDLGYNVHVVYADVPVEEAIKRAEERAKNSEDPANRDRVVPEDVIRDNHVRAAKAFSDARNSPSIDEVRAFDTTSRTPEEFYNRKGKNETVHNQKTLDRIKEKANGQATAAK